MSRWTYITCDECLGTGESEDGDADSCLYCAGEGQVGYEVGE